MRIFGREIVGGRRSIRSREMRVDYAVEKCPGGIKITGVVQGKPGRVEVFRSRAPQEFLLNNWQSWGPIQKMRPGEKHKGIEAVMSRYSPYVFTPIPEVFQKSQVVDRRPSPFLPTHPRVRPGRGSRIPMKGGLLPGESDSCIMRPKHLVGSSQIESFFPPE
ncbi:MAG: hypothetical protein A2Y69_03425 [Candidatus Aminicenantes bacterium RBG_13_59_9]|nr:MAG: hypothetical protein A2Y69_03425 [Candidatus Aminicenantes bacterium RBG_13_59_9]